MISNKTMWIKKIPKKNKTCCTNIRDFRVNMHNGDKNIYT